MNTYPTIQLKPGKSEAVSRFHPWIFSGAISKCEPGVKKGDIVCVVDHRKTFLALGFFQEGNIAVRIFSFHICRVDAGFWLGKIQTALQLRQTLGYVGQEGSNAFRWIFGESDGMPGLIADYYNGTLVIQHHVLGMYLQNELLVEAFRKCHSLALEAIYDKSEITLLKQEQYTASDAYLWGGQQNPSIEENGCRYHVDWESGQKTGFFLDQRENRKLLREFVAGKRLLNTFCYTGGFSINALKAGAAHVTSVDSSKPAMEILQTNLLMNFKTEMPHQSYILDAKAYLQQEKQIWDVVVLDPPAYAKHHSQRLQAMKGYHYINRLALEKIKPGGILFTFSCSQAVDFKSFQTAILSAAIESKRDIKILQHLSQSPDHPVGMFFPESEYLKGLVLYVGE